MYAVIETGGKQFQVEPGQTISVDKLPADIGDEVALDRVLMVGSDEKLTVGTPTVNGAKVIARVVGQGRYRKVIVFKYRNKQRYRRKLGHRQHFTRLKIDRIEA